MGNAYIHQWTDENLKGEKYGDIEQVPMGNISGTVQVIFSTFLSEVFHENR